MELSSTAFEHGERIPDRYTCQGEDVSPPLAIEGVPDEAETLAMVVDDPDAPQPDPWVHWLLWDVPAAADTIPEGYPPSGSGKRFDAARQGTNDFNDVAYGGPCPPGGHGEHTYRFHLYALDTSLGLEDGSTRDQLETAVEDHVLDEAHLAGTYER